MSPGFYFACNWLFGLLGCLILYPVGLFYDLYPEYINELNILVGFTALCFIFNVKKGRDKINENPINLNYICRFDLFKILTIIFLLSALYEFFRLGGNLNMGYARENIHVNMEGKPVLVGYAQTLSVPLCIYAGYFIINSLLNKLQFKTSTLIFLSLPLLGNLIFSVTMGGRVNFVYSFTSYLIGASFSFPFTRTLGELKKPLMTVLLGGIIVLLFITGVANQREKHYRGEQNQSELYLTEINPLLGFIFGPIQYINASYVGYQHRRVDAVDENKLGYGRYTFNGFINWTLPFSGQLGMSDLSIAKTFDIYYHNQETYDFEREFYYTTHSCYLTLIKDFGFYGSLVCIFFLTTLSHKLFVRVQTKKNIMYSSSIFLYFIFWDYWAKSNFYGTLSSTILVPYYGFLLVDILRKYMTKK